jgi:hypothetical protein
MKVKARASSASATKLKPLKVEETKPFTREARRLLSEEGLRQLRQEAAQFRELGSVIRESGGLRKMRWPLENNKGKSHGARIIYFYGGDHMPLYLVAFYSKATKKNLTAAEKKAGRKLVAELKNAYQRKERAKLKIVK